MKRPEQVVIPGAELPKKARKPRGPSRKKQQELDEAYNRGLNAPRDRWPGAVGVIVVAVVAFVVGALIY
jgi:hypothetical protein